MNRGLKRENFGEKVNHFLPLFFFFVFQLMFGNGSDDRTIVEAEGFLDPILRSVVSGFT